MSIKVDAFEWEAEVAIHDGQILRLYIDFAVIIRIQGLFGKQMPEILEDMADVTTMTKVLWGLTRQHHADDLSMNQVAGLLFPRDPANRQFAEAVAATMGNLLRNAFNIDEPDAEGEQSRPPRKPSSGVSRASGKSGSRPASTRTASGKRPRARS